MDSDQIILHAINLIEAGNKTDGRELLRQTVQAEPYNTDAWYVYAQYCGKRGQAVDALEHVLKLEPDYPGARAALERIAPETPPPAELPSPQPAFVALEKDDPWTESLKADGNTPPIVPGKIPTKKKKTAQIPKWFIAATASLMGCLLFSCIGIGALTLVNRPGNARAKPIPSAADNVIPVTGSTPEPTLVVRPYQTPTSTPDPCTCEAVDAYMNTHLARVNQLLTDMNFAATKLKKKTLKEQDTKTLIQNATQMYEAQRTEQIPSCLESYQKDAVKMFWTWQQAVTAIQNGDANGALAFIDIISNDSQQLDVKLAKLANYPTLQACNFAFPTLAAP
jgi:hypothetical protein